MSIDRLDGSHRDANRRLSMEDLESAVAAGRLGGDGHTGSAGGPAAMAWKAERRLRSRRTTRCAARPAARWLA